MIEDSILGAEELESILSELNDRQQRFAMEYCKDLSSGRAAKRAGYKEDNASVIGSRLLNHVKVAKLIEHYKAVQLRSSEITAEMVVKELAKIAFSSSQNVVDFRGNKVRFRDFDDMENPEAISQIEITSLTANGEEYGQVTKFKMHDKLKALEALGRHFAIFTDNVNLKNNGGDLPEPKTIVNVNINHRKPGSKLKKEDEKSEE